MGLLLLFVATASHPPPPSIRGKRQGKAVLFCSVGRKRPFQLSLCVVCVLLARSVPARPTVLYCTVCTVCRVSRKEGDPTEKKASSSSQVWKEGRKEGRPVVDEGGSIAIV